MIDNCAVTYDFIFPNYIKNLFRCIIVYPFPKNYPLYAFGWNFRNKDMEVWFSEDKLTIR